MNYMLERLVNLNENRVLWISECHNEIDTLKLINGINSIDHNKWKGKRVAIGNLSVIEFVFALVFLDGLADIVLILPPEDDSSSRKARLDSCNIDLVIEGKGLSFSTFLNNFRNSRSFAFDDLRQSVIFRANNTTWLLPTSGTTGVPKLIPHSFVSLTRSMSAKIVDDRYIWGCLYSFKRFAGLQVLFQSWISLTPLILSEENLDLNFVLKQYISMGCNALSATPSMWRKLAMYPLFDQLSFKQITLGGEIIDQYILDMLSKKFTTARITHIYASTEAGVGFAVKDLKSGFPVEYLSNPPLNVDMFINESNHLCFRKISEKSTKSTIAENDWIDSGDVVEIRDNRVYFLGRANGSINVGGNKVMPEEVELVIKELANVAFVQVRSRKSSILGNLVEAVITPTHMNIIESEFKQKVIAHCRKRLDGFKVPASIVLIDDINLSSSGKVLRTNIE